MNRSTVVRVRRVIRTLWNTQYASASPPPRPGTQTDSYIFLQSPLPLASNKALDSTRMVGLGIE
jgi:hypothetical protein